MSAACRRARGLTAWPRGKGGIGSVRDDPVDPVIIQEPSHPVCVVHGPDGDLFARLPHAVQELPMGQGLHRDQPLRVPPQDRPRQGAGVVEDEARTDPGAGLLCPFDGPALKELTMKSSMRSIPQRVGRSPARSLFLQLDVEADPPARKLERLPDFRQVKPRGRALSRACRRSSCRGGRPRCPGRGERQREGPSCVSRRIRSCPHPVRSPSGRPPGYSRGPGK